MLSAFRLLLITFCFNMSYCQRRIAGHNYTTVDKRFMVYLIQSNESHPKHNAWLCGGALVRTNKILTSAACLIQTSNIYVIAGYKKYVSTAEVDKDNCTKVTKRRVIKTCVPHGYDFDPSNVTTWMTLDIGVAVVDIPYRSSDVLFRIICHYAPKPIPISYHKELLLRRMDVLAYGWGFMRGRRPGDPSDYNSELLKFTNVLLQNPDVCQKQFVGSEDIIEKYMICAQKAGYLDDDGRIQIDTDHNRLGCNRRYGDAVEECASYEMEKNPAQTNATRRHAILNSTVTSNQTEKTQAQSNETRRQLTFINDRSGLGICQNDHGGPLVTYLGATEMLIGIAVNTVYDTSYQCIGPALFTSTACTSNIVMCMLADNPHSRRSYENVIKEEGFQIIRRDIEWAEEPTDHSAPANEDPMSEDTTETSTIAPTEAIGDKSSSKLHTIFNL